VNPKSLWLEGAAAAIVVRSLMPADHSVWVAGVLLGLVVDRLVVCWPVSVDVVIEVDMGCGGAP
jgi:hypothetical protein